MHSNHSDGLFSVENILAECKKRNIEVISITDHNDINGSLEASKIAPKYGIEVIFGIELFFLINGKITELLAYFETETQIQNFFKEYMQAGRFLPIFHEIDEVTTIIHKHHGIICAPHPFCAKGICENHFETKVEGIEIANATEPGSRNRLAAKYRSKVHLIGLGNSDLHVYKKSLAVYTKLVSEKPITIDEIFQNLRKKKKSIKFIVQNHFKLSLKNRLVFWLYELYGVPKYLAIQFIKRKILRKTD